MPGAADFRAGETLPRASVLAIELEALADKGEAEAEFAIEVAGQRRRFFAQAYPVKERRVDVTGTAILVTDITERARLMDRLTLLAETDGLTGILNRRRLMELGALEIEESRKPAMIPASISGCARPTRPFTKRSDSAETGSN